MVRVDAYEVTRGKDDVEQVLVVDAYNLEDDVEQALMVALDSRRSDCCLRLAPNALERDQKPSRRLRHCFFEEIDDRGQPGRSGHRLRGRSLAPDGLLRRLDSAFVP